MNEQNIPSSSSVCRRTALKGLGALGAIGAFGSTTLAAPTNPPKIQLKQNSVIVFQGDSITDAGRKKDITEPNYEKSYGRGYVGMLAGSLLAKYSDLNLKIYNRGISGNKILDLAKRWQQDTIELKPDVVSILIGVNDLWHQLGDKASYSATVADYETGYRELIERTQRELPGVQKRFIAHGGRGFYSSEDDYGGGVAIDPDNPNIIYISTNAADPFELSDLSNVPLATNERYEIWQGTTSDGGLTFSWQQITSGSGADNLRPIVPANHGYERSVVWFRGTYTSYTNYDTEVVGLFQNQLKIKQSNLQPGQATSSLSWSSEPGKTYRIIGSGDLQSFPHEVANNIDSQGATTSHSFTIPAALSGSPEVFYLVEQQ